MFSALVTHSGAFHADDLFAASVLRTLAPQAPIVRTRDGETIEHHRTAGGIVFDVGMAYDHQRRLYDHHQHNPPLRHEEDGLEVPYSSFGLIWKHYGRAYLDVLVGKDTTGLDSVWAQVDRRMVRRIDMADTNTIPPEEEGLRHPLSITRLLETFTPDFDAPAGHEDEAFETALPIASALLAAKVRTIAADLRAFEQARVAVRNRTDRRWFELPTGMPYLGAVKKEQAQDVLYALMPARDGTWQISAVRQASGEMGCRKPLPAPWAGLRGADLAAVTGVADAEFCHNGRFLAVAGTREGALALLAQALDGAQHQE